MSNLSLDPTELKDGKPLGLRERAALALLGSLTVLPPLAARAYRRMGLLHATAGRTAAAIVSFEAALAGGLTASADLHHQLGLALLDSGQGAAASRHFRRAVELQPGAYWSYQGLGQALVLQGLASEAEAAFRGGLALCPRHVWLDYHLVRLLFAERRFGECLDLLIEIGLSGAEPPASLPLVPFCFDGMATPERIAGLHQVAARRPEHGDYQVLLSLLLVAGGDSVGAVEQLEQYRMRRWRQDALTCDLAPDPGGPKPSFLIIGQGKAGTTALYTYLCQHPQVLPAISKEVCFWNGYLQAGLEWYRANFPPIPTGSGLITGEASPGYLFDNHAPELISRQLPDVKLIVLLRDPVSRAYSSYRMYQRLGRERRPWEQVVAQELAELPTCPLRLEEVPLIFGPTAVRPRYLAGSIVLPFLKRWLGLFPSEQLLILSHAEMHQDTQGTVRRVYRFLGLADFAPDCAERHNVGQYQPMLPEIQQRLEAWFAPHQQALAAFLNELQS